MQSRLGFYIAADISRNIYLRTLYQPYAIHLSRNSSQVIAAVLTKSKHVIVYTIMPVMNILNSFLLVLSFTIALIMIDKVMTIVAMTSLATIYLIIYLLFKSMLVKDSMELNNSQSLLIKILQEGIGGIRDVILYHAQKIYLNAYANADNRLWRAQANMLIIGGSPRFIIEAIGMVLIAGVGYKLASKQGALVGAIPYMGAMAMAAQRLLPSLQQIYAGWTSVRSGQSTLKDVVDMLNQSLPTYFNSQSPIPIRFERSIRFQNIDFRYSVSTQWVLKGLDLYIEKGSRVGIVGSTGCGKSTLLDLVMGLLLPENGVLKIDDELVDTNNLRSWQVHIAHVPQDIFLADASIAENIAFGIPLGQIENARVCQAAVMACIAEDIECWKDKYNTRVGERGVQLSGGQRQRIGIARAFYRQADVIVFDEATSALDNQTEMAVSDSIRKLGKEMTVLIIAHRLSTLQGCDKIVELEDGKVKRQITYEQLISDSEPKDNYQSQIN